MFASICRRRLLFQIPGGGGGGGGSNLLRSILSTIPPANIRYSSSAVADVPNSEPCPDTVSYLTSCGLSPAAAAAATTAQRLRIRSTEKADAVRSLLSHYGFTDADIVRLLRSAPVLRVVDHERILRPKLDFFASLGFKPRKIASSPVLLRCSLDKNLAPSIQFLRDIIGSDGGLRHAFHRQPRALIVDLDNNMRPAVEALRRGGLAGAAISKLLVINLGVLNNSPDQISQVFQDLEVIDMRISNSRFPYCFAAICNLKKETWMRKVTLYRSFGLSEDEVFSAFKTQPMILVLAEESIKKKVRFFLDELKIGIHDIVARPVILGYSLDKCILPRCAVLSVLMREGKIQRDIKLLPALLGACGRFSARYVLRHADHVPDVVKAYEGKIKFEGFGCDR
jgi:mTERF domain-containing protein